VTALAPLRDTLLPRALARATARAWPDVLWRGPAHTPDGHPALYLTVDDGPDADGTPLWRRTLDAAGARALVFLSGPAADARPDLVRALAADGHRVGSHGGAHVSAWRTRGTVGQMARAVDALEQTLGAAVTDVRPPYGRVTPALVRWARATGRRVVLWDTMPGDFLASTTADGVAAEIVRRARPGAVVVLHDGRPARVATGALAVALPRLARAGWRFPALPPASPVPGP